MMIVRPKPIGFFSMTIKDSTKNLVSSFSLLKSLLSCHSFSAITVNNINDSNTRRLERINLSFNRLKLGYDCMTTLIHPLMDFVSQPNSSQDVTSIRGIYYSTGLFSQRTKRRVSYSELFASDSDDKIQGEGYMGEYDPLKYPPFSDFLTSVVRGGGYFSDLYDINKSTDRVVKHMKSCLSQLFYVLQLMELMIIHWNSFQVLYSVINSTVKHNDDTDTVHCLGTLS